jgi:hypothetical protein
VATSWSVVLVVGANETVFPLIVPGPATGACQPAVALNAARKYVAPGVIDGRVMLNPGVPLSVTLVEVTNAR